MGHSLFRCVFFASYIIGLVVSLLCFRICFVVLTADVKPALSVTYLWDEFRLQIVTRVSKWTLEDETELRKKNMVDINDKRWVGKLSVWSKSSGVLPSGMLPLEIWICDVSLRNSLTSESSSGKFGSTLHVEGTVILRESRVLGKMIRYCLGYHYALVRLYPPRAPWGRRPCRH